MVSFFYLYIYCIEVKEMKLSNREVKVCLEYVLNPLFKKYELSLLQLDLKMNHHIKVYAVVEYQKQNFDVFLSFDLDYQKNCLCFYNIKGKIEYLFLKFDIMQVLDQFIHEDNIIFHESSIEYMCDIPIESVYIDQDLEIIMK